MIVGAVLIIGAIGWKFGISPQFERRLSPSWTWSYDTLGSWALWEGDTIDETIFDTPLANDEVAASQFTQTVSDDGFTPASAIVNSYYADVDPVTNQVDFSYTDETNVNPTTARFLEDGLTDYYFTFPRNLQKQTYQLWDTYYGVMNFQFVAEEKLGDLNTYHFRHSADLLDETQLYIDDEYIEPGQGVACIDVWADYWVEPITGDIVQVEENCPREYWIDPVTLETIAPYGRWQVSSSADSTQASIAVVKGRLTQYRWMTLYAPLSIGVIGIVLLFGGIFIPTNTAQEPTQTSV